MNTGIYAIEHVASGRVYIGSAASFAQRWRIHLCLLRKGKHHSPFLQAAWNKYGEAAFVFRKLLVCSKADLIDYEQRAIDAYSSANRSFGFNARLLASSNLGVRHNEEARAKIKAARAKQVFSAETKALWSMNRKGRKMPAGFAEGARQRKLGTKHSEEARVKISAAGMGRGCSAESREKRHGKVTVELANRIRMLHSAEGRSQASIALEFGISQSLVSLIISRKRWNI